MRLSTRACVAALIVLAALAPAVSGQAGTWEERLDQIQQQLLDRAEQQEPLGIAELGLTLGELTDLVRRFDQMEETPSVTQVWAGLSEYSTQQYLSSEAQIAAADQENWIKLVEMLASKLTEEQKRAVALRLAQFVQPEAEISTETRQSRVKLLLSLRSTLTNDEKYELALTLAKTAQPSDLSTLLGDNSPPQQTDAEVPPLAPGFSAEQLAAVAAALDARYLADPAALGGLDFKEMTYLWAALGRCGRDKTQLSDMVAGCVNAADGWRSWGRDDVGRVLVYLKWSSSEAAQSAKVKAADLCIEREIYRFGDDPMLAARAGASLDAMLVSHLRGKLVTAAGEVSSVPATLLSWHYATTDPAERAAWEAEVQQRMEDPALAGDRKAGWLLARAYAGAVGSKFMPLKVDRLLQEVMAVAESEGLRLQAVELLVHGYVLFDLFDHATSLLDSVEGQFADPQSQARLAAWREVIPPRREQAEAVRLAVEKEAKAAHRKVLEERLEQAQQANDSERVARYQRLLEQQ